MDAKKEGRLFREMGFEPALQEGLDAMGFERATPIQSEAIPLAIAGNDLVACAQTGTGKTAAFVLPLLNSILKNGGGKLRALVLAPTRELAQQIDQQIEGISYFTNVSCIPIYGGGDGAIWEQQKRALQAGVEVIIATPGRLISQMSTYKLDFSSLQFLVLDEADRMLDMGFYDDIMRIVNDLPKDRQTLLFSATMPPKIRQLANSILRNPKEVSIAISKPAEGILQQAYNAYEPQKLGLLQTLLEGSTYQSIIIFCSTKEKVKKLYATLQRHRYSAKAFHSDLEQAERETILLDFKNRKLRMLVGTDILSRGIDVEGIDLVVNFDVPPDPEDYIHRIGRTARAQAKGHAITFIQPDDQRRFHRIEQLIGREIEKPALPAQLGEGPVYEPLARRDNDRGFQKGGRSGPAHRKPNAHGGEGKRHSHGSKPHSSGKGSAEGGRKDLSKNRNGRNPSGPASPSAAPAVPPTT